MHDFIYNYWNRTELGRKMLTSEFVSESDLLFLIPNNVKRRYGLPVTRTYGKRKSIIKKNRKNKILSFKLFDIISDIIDETLSSKFSNEEFLSHSQISRMSHFKENNTMNNYTSNLHLVQLDENILNNWRYADNHPQILYANIPNHRFVGHLVNQSGSALYFETKDHNGLIIIPHSWVKWCVPIYDN